MKLWTSEDLADLYVRLLAADVEFVVIGGQAINLWCQHFRAKGRLPDSVWSKFEPFASHDLDLLGGSVDAADAATALQVEAVLFEPQERSTMPNSGTLYVPLQARELIVQFLHTPFGAQREEIRRTARKLEWHGHLLPIMHPVVCLESKIECLFGLDQQTRNDWKHVQLATVCAAEFIRDLIATGQERDALAAIERVADISSDENGLRLWLEKALSPENAIPSDDLKAAAPNQPKLAAFLHRRWPQLQTKIDSRRKRYAELRDRSQTRKP